MSKKTKTYLLIIIIILSWGFVGYKIYSALQGDDEQDLSLVRTEIKKLNEATKEDSIILLLNYPDPFLKGGNYTRDNRKHSLLANPASPNVKSAILVKPKQEVVPPTLNIKYVGLVKNNEKGTSTAMISINDKSSFVKEKDVVEGFTVLEIAKNSIKLKKGKEIFTINK